MIDVKAIAEDYCRMSGIGTVADRLAINVDPVFHVQVAFAYHAIPDRDRRADSDYRRLVSEVGDQFDHCVRAGIRFDPFGDDVPDPYGNRSEAMTRDVIVNGHLWVYNGGSDHPFLSRDDNWRFRAIHDVFGHAMHRYSFGPNGEESAYRCHRAMFSEEAGRALATETRGQNSWVNFGPYAHLPRSERPFAEQKAAILPEWARGNYPGVS